MSQETVELVRQAHEHFGMVWTFRDARLVRLDYFNDQAQALEAVGLRE
jgi:ketosteroid isomerase-like protein